MTANARTAVTALVVACVALAFVGPAAALGSDSPDGTGGAVGATNHADDSGGNSTLYLVQSVETGQGGGWLIVECEGTPTNGQHACDKRGAMSAGPLGIDYDEGYNYANPTALSGGGGDEVTVTVGNRSGTGEFDCTFRTDTMPTPCTVNGSSSETGGVSLP